MRFIIAIALLFATSFSVLADDGDDDHDWARDAVLSGDAIPLAQIIESIETSFEAKVYEVGLIKSDNANVASMYRVKLISDDGHLIELLVDTASGIPVGMGGQGIEGDDEEDEDEEHEEHED